MAEMHTPSVTHIFRIYISLFVKKNTSGVLFFCFQKHGTFQQLEVPFHSDYDVLALLYLTDYLTPEFTSD